MCHWHAGSTIKTQSCVFVNVCDSAKRQEEILKRPSGTTSFARLSIIAIARIIGLRETGTRREEVRDRVRKTDGAMPSLQAIDDVYGHFLNDPEWQGESSRAVGRPRDLSEKQE